jgi:hypothetical protein
MVMHELDAGSAVVKRQSIVAWALLRRASLAGTSRASVAAWAMRRSRHWRLRMESSLSDMFNQLPC